MGSRHGRRRACLPFLRKPLLHCDIDTSNVLELFPESARVEDGELTLGGVPATRLGTEYGTPLVVYGTKAFANVALLRLLAEEAVGADVSTLGELAFAHAAGIDGERILFHGNNKSVEELRAAAQAGATVVVDAPWEVDAAIEAGVRHALVRLTPGVEAVTHRSIQTAHEESKFGLSPEVAAEVIVHARDRGLEIAGLHVHIGSQLVLEPGRSLVGRAGVTLYHVGVVKESSGVVYAAIDGGMSDNPRPQLYGARYEALLANRAGELATGVYRIAGKHCESGDVLIEAAELPHPEPGDLIAVPATGAYTLALGSTYNGVPRPAVVLVEDGESRVIRRREMVQELLRYEET